MPKQKDLKRRVRERMRKTGESYTAARARLVAKRAPAGPDAGPPPAEYAAIAEIRDEAVAAKTGHPWAHWVKVLDRAGAAGWPHREIAAHLRDAHGLSAWWSQSVTVGYERIRGLRARGQRRGGTFDVNKSKTLPVPVSTLYRAFQARGRARWLEGGDLTIRTSTVDRSMRARWTDGTPVDLYFWPKGPAKSQVQLQHRGLPSRARADELRAHWTAQLARLADHVRG